MMQYKGYTGRTEIDADAGIIHGEVAGLRDVVTFQGKSVEEAVQAFQDSVDDYLEFCREMNRPPEKPYSGRFNVRTDPELHRDLARLAALRGESLNTLVSRALRLITEQSFGTTGPKVVPGKQQPSQATKTGKGKPRKGSR